MTTTVKIVACCDTNTEVIISVKDFSVNTDKVNTEDVLLQDGETYDLYVYDNREVIIKEREKEK